MAYDEDLAERVRELLSPRGAVKELRMFGGVGFTIAGNMAVGVIQEDLIVRLDPEDAEKALAEDGVREFDFTGRPMKGWVFVSPEGTSDDEGLGEWVEAGAGYAASLPPK
ncbi:MAG TPA: TfoX/Sxy family protein [Solirubrobacterales bacterium]|nr:TfoX/Sxy family protein [Solirubrobacterales bacterium]